MSPVLSAIFVRMIPVTTVTVAMRWMAAVLFLFWVA